MKIEKQIELCALDIGKKYFELSESMDCITVNESSQYSWFADVQDNDTFLYIPILQKGVFIINYLDYQNRLLFDVKIEENEITIDTNTIYIKDNIAKWICDCIYTIPFKDACNFDFKTKKYADPTTAIYTKQNKSITVIQEYMDKYIESNAEPFMLFIRTMAWINYLMEHPQQKVIVKNDVGASSKKPNNNTNYTTHNNNLRTVNLNDIFIKTSDKKTVSKIKSKQIHRVACCWSVRGHFRHYKSGKVVYIKPFEKGNGRTNIIKKNYKL